MLEIDSNPFSLEINRSCWIVLGGVVTHANQLKVCNTLEGLAFKIETKAGVWDCFNHRRIPRNAFYDVTPDDVIKRVFMQEPTADQIKMVKRLPDFYRNIETQEN